MNVDAETAACLLFEGAKGFWPEITWEEFRAAALVALDQLGGSASLQAMSLLIYNELVRRRGPSSHARPAE